MRAFGGGANARYRALERLRSASPEILASWCQNRFYRSTGLFEWLSKFLPLQGEKLVIQFYGITCPASRLGVRILSKLPPPP